MDNSNERTRKRDIFKHGLDKATSKLGLSSQSQAGPSHMYNAMASTVTNSMSVMPTFSQANQNACYPTPPVWPHVDNPDEVHWKAPPDSRTSGQKLAVNYDRLSGGLNQDNDEKKKKKKKKVEDTQTGPKDDGKKKKSHS